MESTEDIFRVVTEKGDFIGRRGRISDEVKGLGGVVAQVRTGGPSLIITRGRLVF